MSKVSPIQTDFSSGELSSLFYGRVDNERYKGGLAVCKNFIPTTQGGLVRRPGTMYVANSKFPTKKSRLIPFEFSTTQAYMLEFGDAYVRFFKDNGIITNPEVTITGATQANPVVITAPSHGFSNGFRVIVNGVGGMTELDNREFTVANVTANTFELSGIDGTGFSAYTSGGTVAQIYEIVSPFLEADLFQIKFTQSADVLYLAHTSYPTRKLTRTGHTAWTMTQIDFLDGPYLATNTTTTTLTPSASSGLGITITASAVTGINHDTGFKATDVGRLIRMKTGTSSGYVKIVGFTSTTVVTADVIKDLTDTTARLVWRLGVWSETTGFPGTVVFHEDRLWLAGCADSPQRLDGSKTGDYENFAPTDADSNILASNGVSFSLNANDVNLIRWLTSDEKGLLVGSVGGEWVVKPSSQAEALSPTNVNAKRATHYGSANIQPVQLGKATHFIQRAGKKLREMTYFYEVDGFKAPDLTVLSEQITGTGVAQLSYQKEPQSIVWAVRTDGQLAAMTYERDVDSLKVGWHRSELGGYGDAVNGAAIVESAAVIPSPDGTREELWLVVKRYINGSIVRYIEYVTKIFDDNDEQRDAFFVDSGLTFDNPVTITAATQADPVVITAASHGFSNGDKVLIDGIKGMTQLNTNTYTVANAAANTFELSGIDGTAFDAYVSDGEVRKLVTTISGLNHLEGETISILADGAVQPDKVVTGGRITLSVRAAVIQMGFKYRSQIQMLRLDAGARDGTSIGKTRRTHRYGIMLHRSLGLRIGMNFDEMDRIIFRTTSDPLSRAPGLFSGIVQEIVDADYDTENQLCLEQDQPLPTTILAIMPQMVTQDRG